MILAAVGERFLEEAVLRAALPDEDVFTDPDLILSGARFGFPRALVYAADVSRGVAQSVQLNQPDLPAVMLSRDLLGRWESAWAERTDGVSRLDDAARKLRTMIQLSGRSPAWIDEVFRALTSAAGRPLPAAFRGFARRVLEFPRHYSDLHGISRLTESSRDAVKARFRRRDLPSPFLYLRWLRAIAVSYALAEPSATTARVAYRFGYSSGGNLCRSVQGLLDMTTVEMRSPMGRSKLLIRFAAQYLGDEQVARWAELEDLFLSRAVA